MLGRDDGSLDHEDVEAGFERHLVMGPHLLGRERRCGNDPLCLDLPDPLGDQLGLDRLLVDVLHLTGRDVAGEARDPLELRIGILVAAEDPFQVEDRQPAELADDTGRLGRDDAVERRRQQRQLEPVRPERPSDVYVVGVPRAPGRHDGDVIEAVCATALLASTDLNFHGGSP